MAQSGCVDWGGGGGEATAEAVEATWGTAAARPTETFSRYGPALPYNEVWGSRRERSHVHVTRAGAGGGAGRGRRGNGVGAEGPRAALPATRGDSHQGRGQRGRVKGLQQAIRGAILCRTG